MLFFYLFHLVFSNSFKNPAEIENARQKLALVTPTGVPVIVANDAIEILPVVTEKTINDLSK